MARYHTWLNETLCGFTTLQVSGSWLEVTSLVWWALVAVGHASSTKLMLEACNEKGQWTGVIKANNAPPCWLLSAASVKHEFRIRLTKLNWLRLISQKNFLCNSGDKVSQALGKWDAEVCLPGKAEEGVLDWISVDSRLCAVTLWWSVGVRKDSYIKRTLFFIPAYTPIDYSCDTQKRRVLWRGGHPCPQDQRRI